METGNDSQDPVVQSLGVTVSLQRRTEQQRNISSGTSAKAITFPSAFYSTPSITITATNMATGDFFELSSVSRTGFTITFRDSGGSIVDRNFDYQAVGHGKGDHLMAQATDYSLANQSGANFRTELNSILGAVQTLNSGSSAPSNLVAHMVFLDTSTTPATLKIRNAANDGFITLGTASTNFGLVSASGATFTGDITLNAQSDVRFADSDSSNYIALQAPATVSSNVTFTLPSADGTANQAH